MLVARSAACLAASLLLALPALAQGGAVYTTDRTGGTVNGNVYNKDRDVYLTGGPGPNAPCSSSGLPDGEYYFQVTDPSGSTCLSTDGIEERRVRVTGGVVSHYLGSTHSTRNNGPCGAVLVQLIPFAPTPSNGSEYKLWLTPVDRYDPYLSGFWGFQAKYSKTDNFKIKEPGRLMPQSAIRGYKFFDHSEDGVWNPSIDPLEVAIPGWRIELWQNGVLDRYTFTDDMGRYTFLVDQGTYTIREVAPGGFIGDGIPGAIWLATTPREAAVVADAAEVAGPDFGNLSFEVKVGVGRTKGFWHNQNGRDLLEACDPIWRDALTTFEGTPLCLRRNVSSSNPAESIFAPLPLPTPFATAFDDWANYVVGNPAYGHAGFILSTQVAATVLNNRCGFMQFTVYVDRFKDGVLVSLQDMLRGVQGLLCDPRAGESGPNDPYPDYRDRILACINEFGEINNTGDPNNDQTVYGPTSLPSGFSSPYE